MIPGERNQVEANETQHSCESNVSSVLGDTADLNNAESMEDSAWLQACRKELHDDPESSETADNRSDSLAMSDQISDDGENLATRSEASDSQVATEKTGDDAMSKFGHAIGALAESEDDFDEQSLDYAAELAAPSSRRDEAVAPHIAAAERELETSRNAGSLDIFDRIAQAAESQFDESRGSTAKRVSELVDDRRVGTKRWTPSKTMKQRMEKLEAARAAAAGEAPAATDTDTGIGTKVAAAAGAGAAAVAAKAASAPTSSTATMVKPKTQQTAKPEAEADAELIAEEQRVSEAQPSVEESAQAEMSNADEAVIGTGAVEDDAADTLRLIPGARGRRRDRARKSRLDEDFEKVFDDDGKPSINSLRRKLRSAASSEAEADAESGVASANADSGVMDPESGVQPKKKGLFSRLLQSKAKKAPEDDQLVDADMDMDEDDLVAAFESDNQPLGETDIDDTLDDDDLQAALDTKRKQKRIAMPIIGIGAIIGLVGIGWVAYRFLFG